MSFARRKCDFEHYLAFARRKTDLNEKVILVDSENYLSAILGNRLTLEGIEAQAFEDGECVLGRISRQWHGVVLVHLEKAECGALEFLEKVVKTDPDLPVILIVGQGNIPLVVQVMRRGAYDVIEKPFSGVAVLKTIKRALEKRALILENRGLRSEIAVQERSGSFVVGKSPAMGHLVQSIEKVAEVDADVLLCGETGTGKELAARCLHEQSGRRTRRFVAVNCCAIPQEILESELFGHEAGAFTGAQARRVGKFEYANGGTLYLDEIDSMPLNLQGKLLRVLQERHIERLGSNQIIPVDIRVIASTKVDLQRAGEEGKFRQDLFYRLNVIRIPLPPLREHREDIPLLFQYFVVQACAKFKRPMPPITNETLHDLMGQDWPGNVRELKNAADRFTLDCHPELPPPNGPGKGNGSQNNAIGKRRTLVEQINDFEKTLIVQELARTRGDVKATYTTLGLPRKTLYDKMRKYALKRKDFLEPA